MNQTNIDNASKMINTGVEAPPTAALCEHSPHSDGPQPKEQKHTFADCPLRVYVKNANNAQIGGVTIPLPTDAESLQPFLNVLEVQGQHGVLVSEIYSHIDNLAGTATRALENSISPEPLSELNCLAAKIAAMYPEGFELFAAALEAKIHCGSLAEMINLTENIECFDLQPAFNAKQYGDFLIQLEKDNTSPGFEKLANSIIPDDRALAQYIQKLEMYVDAAAYGRAAAKEENGVFTEYGYLTGPNDEYITVYSGPEDMPEYRVNIVQAALTENPFISQSAEPTANNATPEPSPKNPEAVFAPEMNQNSSNHEPMPEQTRVSTKDNEYSGGCTSVLKAIEDSAKAPRQPDTAMKPSRVKESSFEL
jgi:hypothetical protein